MKKIISLVLAAVLILAVLCSCGETSTESAVAELYDDGYSSICYELTEDNTLLALYADDNGENFKKVSAPLSASQLSLYSAMSVADDDYNDQLTGFMLTLTDVTVTDLNEFIPDDGDFDDFDGKTVGDLLDAGYEKIGSMVSDNDCQIYAADEYCQYVVYIRDYVEDIEALTDEQLRALEIRGMEFDCFTSSILHK